MENAALIQALREGSQQAFRELVSAYGDRVYNTVLSLMQDPQDAEDVVQEVFVAIYENIGRFRGESKLSTWMYRIAVTRSLEALRKIKRKDGNTTIGIPETKEAAPFYHPGLQAENRELGILLFKALQRLPDTQKTAFILHKAEGLSHEEIAAVMHQTIPGIESLIYRARQNLRALLSDYYKE